MTNYPTRNGLKQTPLKKGNGLKPVSEKQRVKNNHWHIITCARREELIEKFGRCVCEYSGETITELSSSADNPEAAWGHHIDRNRNNGALQNCYIVKYKYHRKIHDHNIKVTQEDFQGAAEIPRPVVRELE